MSPTNASLLRTARLLLAAVAILILPACDDSTSPRVVTGSYALERVNGHELPYRWTQGEFTEDWLDAASVTLRRDGAFLYTADWRVTYANGNPASETTVTTEGTYRVRGDELDLLVEGEWWADATLDGDELRLIGQNFVEHVFVKR